MHSLKATETQLKKSDNFHSEIPSFFLAWVELNLDVTKTQKYRNSQVQQPLDFKPEYLFYLDP